jgi:hypothetical protein
LIGGAGEDTARVKGKKIVAIVMMTSAVKDNAAEGARLKSVGGDHMDLGVGAKFKEGASTVETGGAGDKVGGGVVLEDVVVEAGKMIEVEVGKGDEVMDEGLGKAFVGKAVDEGAKILFDGADGAFNVRDMPGGVDNVEMDIRKKGGQRGEFVVNVAGADVETTGLVKGDNAGEVTLHFGCMTGGGDEGVAETEGARDAVEEGDALYVKKIETEGNVAVVGEDVRRESSREEGRYVLLRDGGGVAFKARDVGTIDETGTAKVIRSDGAVTEVAMRDGMLENRIAGATKEDREVASCISIVELAASKLPFVGGYGG